MFQDAHVTPDQAKQFASEAGFLAPVIVIGSSAFSGKQFYVVVEDVIVEAAEFTEAFTTLICMYYILNIAYPKGVRNTLTFVQKFLLKINDSEAIPAKVNTLARMF